MNKLLLLCLIWLSSCALTVPQYTSIYPANYYVPVATNVYNSPHGMPTGSMAAGTNCIVVGEFNHWLVVQGSGSTKYWMRRDALFSGRAPSSYSTYSAPSYSPPSYSPPTYSPTPQGTTHDTYTGPRGGHYYINGNGNKTYVTPQSTINNNYIQTGPRGGQYYINSHGNKSYIKH